jgi:hypothetical protein
MVAATPVGFCLLLLPEELRVQLQLLVATECQCSPKHGERRKVGGFQWIVFCTELTCSIGRLEWLFLSWKQAGKNIAGVSGDPCDQGAKTANPADNKPCSIVHSTSYVSYCFSLDAGRACKTERKPNIGQRSPVCTRRRERNAVMIIIGR